LALVGVPRAGLLDHVVQYAQLDDLAIPRNTLAVHDLELCLAKWRCDLVLDHLDARLVADDLFARLDRADAADVEPHGGVELQRVAARGRFGVAEHDT